jgi:hypothetical protein
MPAADLSSLCCRKLRLYPLTRFDVLREGTRAIFCWLFAVRSCSQSSVSLQRFSIEIRFALSTGDTSGGLPPTLCWGLLHGFRRCSSSSPPFSWSSERWDAIQPSYVHIVRLNCGTRGAKSLAQKIVQNAKRGSWLSRQLHNKTIQQTVMSPALWFCLKHPLGSCLLLISRRSAA